MNDLWRNGSTLPALEPGAHVDQKTFHERYEAMPPGTRAELIGGIVFMPSPLKRPHSRMHARVMNWLTRYEDATPGVEVHDNGTAILDDASEPQPDAYLIIAPERGGQTNETDDLYLKGAPELIVEVALSSESIDLHRKRDDYERAGVKEYVVVTLRSSAVFWFVRRDGRFVDLPLGGDGVLRSETFPGLWLDPLALLNFDKARVAEVLEAGLASSEHSEFVIRLAGTA